MAEVILQMAAERGLGSGAHISRRHKVAMYSKSQGKDYQDSIHVISNLSTLELYLYLDLSNLHLTGYFLKPHVLSKFL